MVSTVFSGGAITRNDAPSTAKADRVARLISKGMRCPVVSFCELRISFPPRRAEQVRACVACTPYPLTGALAVLSAVALLRFGVNSAWLVAGGAAAGLILSAVR